MHRGIALITNPGANERQKEMQGIEGVAQSLGCKIIKVTNPGTLDGGDVLKVGDTIYVGNSARTTKEGIKQLENAFKPARTVSVDVTKVLHLKSAISALSDGTVLGWPQAVDDSKVFGKKYVEMPEEAGAHIVILDESTVLMGIAPKSAQVLKDRGLNVIQVDISEFVKREGCVTCLSVRVRELPSDSIYFSERENIDTKYALIHTQPAAV